MGPALLLSVLDCLCLVSVNETLKQSERRLRATSFSDHWFSVATVKFNSLHLTGDYQDTTAKNHGTKFAK